MSQTSAVFAPWAEADAKPLISFDRVTKSFGGFIAVDDLSVDIYEREFFALLGPSGCGKTTMMRMLAGFETPTEGEIRLGGEVLRDQPPNARPVNMMFQSYALFPHLSVADNIAFGLKRSQMSKPDITARTEQMLELVQLKDFAKRKPHQLSGGQRQRVALARSLAKSPKLLLLDEPLGALDKKLRQQTQFELMNIQESLGTTFMIVTHDQEEAMTVASRIAVMDKGKIIQVATPGEIYEYPINRYVADFIGDVNVIEAHATGTDTATLTRGEGLKPLEASWGRLTAGDGKLWLALRPEKVQVSVDAPQGTSNALQGKVIDIAYSGNLTTYHVEIDSGQIVMAQEVNRRHLADRSITWEDPVWLSWDKGAGVLMRG